MLCPHCATIVHFDWSSTNAITQAGEGFTEYELHYAACPNCSDVVVKLRKGTPVYTLGEWIVNQVQWEKIIHPKAKRIDDTESVPAAYLEDYEEAVKVLSSSPKASAALTRRLLQNIIREEYNITERVFQKKSESLLNNQEFHHI